MKLTDSAVKNAKPNPPRPPNPDSSDPPGPPPPRRLFDGRGLYLEISWKGKKGWRFKYRFGGREKRISFGIYPDVTLKHAREQMEQAREMLARGIDPSQQRRIAKLQTAGSDQNTFEAVAAEWHNTRKAKWSKIHQTKVLRMLERNLYPSIGKIPIDKITAPILLKALRKIEAEGKYETAMRAKQTAGQVFRYGVLTRQIGSDVTPYLKGELITMRTKHMPAIVEPKEVGKLMLAIEEYKGSLEVCSALRLAPLVFVRPGELRHAEWSEIDLDAATWIIKGDKMKMKNDHEVPLSRQAVKILRDIKKLTGNYRYVFPSARSPERPMSNNALRIALRTMGYTKDQIVPHGFRATARTLIDEQLGFNVDWIEHQLAHAVKDANGKAYNRTTHIEGRRKMVQAYANYLDKLKAEAAANIR